MPEPVKRITVSAFEPTDVGGGFIWGVVGLCLAILLLCALAVVWLYPHAMADRGRRLLLPIYPEPHLQADPVADLRRYHALALQQLNATDAAHIPIATAMRQIANEGIPEWPAP